MSPCTCAVHAISNKEYASETTRHHGDNTFYFFADRLKMTLERTHYPDGGALLRMRLQFQKTVGADMNLSHQLHGALPFFH